VLASRDRRAAVGIETVARLNRATRWWLVLAAAGWVAVFGIARTLQPDPRGFGTHRQLGLPPCAFQRLTGRRCPTCGMTTAVTWVARGRLDRAWQANPAGGLLGLAGGALVPWLLTCALWGRPCWGARSLNGPVLKVFGTVVAVDLIAWIIRWPFGRV
jgi:hypothetical protein